MRQLLCCFYYFRVRNIIQTHFFLCRYKFVTRTIPLVTLLMKRKNMIFLFIHFYLSLLMQQSTVDSAHIVQFFKIYQNFLN